MMKRFFLILLVGMCTLTGAAQTNKLIKELEGKRTEIQKQISETESLLKTTKKDVGSQLKTLSSLSGQIAERRRYIETITSDVDKIEGELSSLERQLRTLQTELKDKKKKYESSVQYLYKNKTIEEKLMFIFSAENLGQMYRRLRYVREYATYQRIQGEEILKKQEQIRRKKQELLQVKQAKEALLVEREAERAKLEEQEKEKKNLVNKLKKQQRGLQNEISQKRKQANALNARIDRLINEEIERARKRAEEQARKEAEARRKAEQEASRAEKKTSSKKSSSSDKSKTEKKEVAKPMESYSMSKADRELSDNFESNRGRLPIPLTGAYMIVGQYGEYNVEGMKNVRLDSKGIDLQGRSGAQARSIFNGKITAIFKMDGLYNVIIRHGNYMSVYCNLSSVSVREGESVSTRQSIGTVFSDASDGGRTVLHFQLRKNRDKLNPLPWLDR